MKDHMTVTYAHTHGIAMVVVCSVSMWKRQTQDKSSMNFFSASGNGTLIVQELSTTRILNRREFFSIYTFQTKEKLENVS